jgi:hypothetical protein
MTAGSRAAPWQAFERHAKVPSGGYSNVDSVHELPANCTKQDKQETWWFAETLKYLVCAAPSRTHLTTLHHSSCAAHTLAGSSGAPYALGACSLCSRCLHMIPCELWHPRSARIAPGVCRST